MQEMIAYCGLDCAQCPAYLATQKNDDAARAQVAALWSKLFRMEIKAEQINCDGCHSVSGRLIGHCSTCPVRKCGQEKGLENCGHCPEYSCAQLDGLLKFIPNPTARENLERIVEGRR